MRAEFDFDAWFRNYDDSEDYQYDDDSIEGIFDEGASLNDEAVESGWRQAHLRATADNPVLFSFHQWAEGVLDARAELHGQNDRDWLRP